MLGEPGYHRSVVSSHTRTAGAGLNLETGARAVTCWFEHLPSLPGALSLPFLLVIFLLWLQNAGQTFTETEKGPRNSWLPAGSVCCWWGEEPLCEHFLFAFLQGALLAAAWPSGSPGSGCLPSDAFSIKMQPCSQGLSLFPENGGSF